MNDLVTERLVLHPLSAAEAERVAAGGQDGRNDQNGDDRWAPGYPAEGDVVGARRYVTTCAITGDPRPFGAYEIRRREDGLAIGGLGFHGAPDEDGSVTVGYGLIPSARGRGYASEALRELLRFARERGVAQVNGDTDHGNLPSQRAMSAAGMELVAEDGESKYYRITWSDAAGPAAS